jgi:hypothetical protein
MQKQGLSGPSEANALNQLTVGGVKHGTGRQREEEKKISTGRRVL